MELKCTFTTVVDGEAVTMEVIDTAALQVDIAGSLVVVINR